MIRAFYIYDEGPLSERTWSDMSIYVSIADQILMGNWKVHHFFQSIGYPLFISFLKLSFNDWALMLSTIQALASFGTLIFMYKLTLKSFGEKTALITLIIASFHLPWVMLPGFALPETFFTFFLSVCAWYTYKIVIEETSVINLMIWGTSFILGFWLKGTHVFWAPLFLLGLLVQKKKMAIRPVKILSFVLVLGLGLHGYLSYTKIGKIQLSASAGGLNFVEGKCPSKKNQDTNGQWWHSPLYTQLNMNEFKQWDRPFTDSGHYMRKGLECIIDNPLVLIQSVESIPYLFFGNRMWPLSNTPNAPVLRFYELFFSVFLIVGMAVMVREFLYASISIEQKLIWTFPVLSLFLCVYIFKSELRYRIPFDVWFIPLSVNGWMVFLKGRTSHQISTAKLAVSS